ncbi:MAG: hypothetical protein GW809_04535 [Bacteroidetes bacterium]|nr:hypothetical protein [Bacteroidota bacterium]
MLIQSLFSLIVIVLAFTHPYFVSIWDIELNEKTQTVQITCKVFLDDVESGLKKRFNVEKWDWKKTNADSLAYIYLQESISLQLNDSVTSLHVVGKETEFDVVYFYMESEKVELPQAKIHLEIPFLVEAIEDQTNLAHLKQGSLKKSFILNSSEQTCDYEFKLN